MNRKGQAMTNVYTYLIIIFIFIILTTGLIYMGNELISNSNANPDNDSIEYIAQIQGINLSEYRAEREALEKLVSTNENYSQGNPKDEALDFQFAKEKGNSVELVLRTVFNFPSRLLVDILRLPLNNWKWLIDIVVWLLGLTVGVAVYYFIRGLATR